jgi:hypothetical protein
VVTPPAPLAASVNGEYIFLADYQGRVTQYEEMLLAQGLDPRSEAGQAQLTQMQLDVLEAMIDTALIEQGAEALGLRLGSDALEASMQASIAAGGGEAAFEEWLGATGQSRDEYTEMLREALLLRLVLRAVSNDGAEDTDSDGSANLRVAALERWLAEQRETAVIERFVGE